MIFRRKNLELCFVVLLAGCGGGGGGGGSPAVTPATQFLPQGNNASLRTLNAEESFSAISATTLDAPAGPSTSTPGLEADSMTVTLRPTSANPKDYDVRIQARDSSNGRTATLNFSVDSLARAEKGNYVAGANLDVRIVENTSGSSQTSRLFMNDLASARWNIDSQAFGFWSQSEPAQSGGGYFSAGIATPPETIPLSGQATYSGAFLGLAAETISGFTSTSVITSRFDAVANFTDRSIKFATSGSTLAAFSNPFIYDSNDTWDLDGLLTWNPGDRVLQGSVYNGALTGAVSARFYGTAAKELGGVLVAGTDDASRLVTGSFGAALEVNPYRPVGVNFTLRAPTATQELSVLSTIETGPSDPGSELLTVPTIHADGTVRVTFLPTSPGELNKYGVRIQANDFAAGQTVDTSFIVHTTTSTRLNTGLYSTPSMDLLATAPPFPSDPFAVLITNDLRGNRPSLSHQLFGAWSANVSVTSSTNGFFSAGLPTPPSAIPSSGTLSYSGTLFGTAVTGANTASRESFALSAVVTGTANFATRQIVFSTANSQTTPDFGTSAVWTPDPSWNVGGTLSWSAGQNVFRGTVNNTDLTGSAVGRFYGFSAQEIGGLVSAVSADGNRGMLGAFGAAR